MTVAPVRAELRPLLVFRDDGGPDRQELGGTTHQHRRRESRRYDGVRPEFACFVNHPVETLFAALGDEFRVLVDFAADDVAQARQDIPADDEFVNSDAADSEHAGNEQDPAQSVFDFNRWIFTEQLR